MNKSRTCLASELYQVANSVIVSPTAIALENFNRAWARVRVPRLNRELGTLFWAHEWCAAYDERLIALPITLYILTPDKQRYIDPDFTEDLQEACSSGEDLSIITSRRAVTYGLSGRPVRHCPACGRLVLAGKACC